MKKLLIFLMVLFTTALYAQNITLVDLEKAAEQIRAKEQELMQREEGLNSREERLNALEKDLLTREGELKNMRTEISGMLNTVTEANEADLAALAKIYGSTKAKQAAAVIIKMDLEQSAEILRRMTAMNAGKLMAEIAKQDPDYASRLSVTMAGKEPPVPPKNTTTVFVNP